MSYPERQPIYRAYKQIIDKIIEEKKLKEYAEAEINDLNQSILNAFQEISNAHLLMKWPTDI